MKPKILISITSQFGYHTDTYMYCKYLDKNKYEVHYVGFDNGHIKRHLNDVQVHYILVFKNKIYRYWYYVRTINKLIRREKFDVLFLVDSQGSLLIRMFNLFRKTFLDIRTGDVWMNKKQFSLYDLKARVTTFFFKRISIISLNLANKIKLPLYKCHNLPLGGDSLSTHTLDFEQLQLFYIGIIHGRNIDDTVKGVLAFRTLHPKVAIKYDIVGYGTLEEESALNDTIKQSGLEDVVRFHGRKNHDEIKQLIVGANVGVVYIPMTYGFDCQPTTKLYEYLLTGIPVIATNTLENRIAIKAQAGVLINDTPEDFADGLKGLWDNRRMYHSDTIKNLYSNCSWENIVKQNLEPYLDTVIANKK